MIVVRSLLGALDLLWLKVYCIIYLNRSLCFCAWCFWKVPQMSWSRLMGTNWSWWLIDQYLQHWLNAGLKGGFFVPDREICNVDVLYSRVLLDLSFFSILQPLQIQTRSTSGDFLTMQWDSRSPVGLVFHFSDTPKSPFCLIFTKIMLYIVFNLRFSCFSPTLVLGSSLFCTFSDCCYQWNPDYMLLEKFPYMNFSELYFYVCTLLDCLLW